VSSTDAMASGIVGWWIKVVAGCSTGMWTLASELLRRLLLVNEAVLDGRRGRKPFT